MCFASYSNLACFDVGTLGKVLLVAANSVARKGDKRETLFSMVWLWIAFMFGYFFYFCFSIPMDPGAGVDFGVG